MISFDKNGQRFKLENLNTLKKWIKATINEEGLKTGDISYVFMDDDELLSMNEQYLKHDTLTDIITFDLSDNEDLVEGEIFISIPRIKENAKTFEVGFTDELKRVMIHGILHLCGYEDETKELKAKMRSLEDYYLKKYIEPL